MNRESSTEEYTLTYINRQSRGICCMTRELQLGLCNSLEELGRVGGGRELQEGGDIYTPLVHSC